MFCVHFVLLDQWDKLNQSKIESMRTANTKYNGHSFLRLTRP